MKSSASLFTSIAIILAVLIVAGCSRTSNPQKPNIILIYADDLGIGMLGHEGQEIIKTPNIDQLAKDGIRFERSYANMLCAPARASLITGLHDCHADYFQVTPGRQYIDATFSNLDSIQSTINETLRPNKPKQVFLGEIAQNMGYKTAQFGKLEWGFSATHQQMEQHGWDHYMGYYDHNRAHGFYPPFLFENGELINIEGNTLKNCGKSGEPETPETYAERWNMTGKKVYSQDLFMDRVLDFIDTNKNNPFFLYFPTQLPHGPVSIPRVHPDFINDSRLTQIEKEYASMVKLLDDNVGQIIQKLKDQDLEENTIVIFTADNGHEIYYTEKGRTHKPYTNMETGVRFDDYEQKFYSGLAGDVFNGNGGRAGMKRSNLEGGINVPLIIRWPSVIEGGRTSQRLTANYDLLPTIADIVGFSKDYPSDGLSFFKELLVEKNQSEHEFVVYSSFVGPSLISNDGWKLRTYLKYAAFELYFLPDDPSEKNDLAAEFPDRVQELKAKLLEACEGDFDNGHFSYAKR